MLLLTLGQAMEAHFCRWQRRRGGRDSLGCNDSRSEDEVLTPVRELCYL